MQQYYKLRPSRSLALILLFLCVVSLATLLLLALPVAVRLILTVVVLCWGGYSLLLDAILRMGHSCLGLRLEDGEEIVLLLRSGRHLSCRVSPDSWVTPYLIVLNVILSDQRGRRSLMILPDAMGEESFRRLRVALRWGGKADQAAT